MEISSAVFDVLGSVEKLTCEMFDGVQTIVCHHNSKAKPCPDGMASAILLRDAFPDAQIKFASYGPELDNVSELDRQLRSRDDNILPMPGLLFCDISPNRSQAKAYVDAGAIVLDHHEHQKDVVAMFGARGLYGENAAGQSGAMLAYYVWVATSNKEHTLESRRALQFAVLASTRDCFIKSSPHWLAACEQAAALSLYTWEDWERIRSPFLDGFTSITAMMAAGKPLYAQRLAKSRQTAEQAIICKTSKGTKVALVNDLDTSDVAELVDADILAGYQIIKREPAGVMPTLDLQLSLRSRYGYDVGALAKHYKGGGHRAAAGCQLDQFLSARAIRDEVSDLSDAKANSDLTEHPATRIMYAIQTYEDTTGA